MIKEKGYKEAFARFFEEPSRERLRVILKENSGETNNLDFKEEWPKVAKLARHVLGLANSRGGCLVVGVSQRENGTLDPVGLSRLKDKTEVINPLASYLPEPLMSELAILDFSYEASEYPRLQGKSFQVLIVDCDPAHLPFLAKRDGDGVRNNVVYVRRGTASTEANHEELQRILNRRLDTGYSSRRELDLRTHLEQLKILFGQISPYGTRLKDGSGVSSFGEAMKGLLQPHIESVPNPNYPEEGFEAFIVRGIARKKRRIEEELDLG
jgi:hypothetical protein